MEGEAPCAGAGVYAEGVEDDQLDERDVEDRSVTVHPPSLQRPARGEVNYLGAIHLIPLIQFVIPLTS